MTAAWGTATRFPAGTWVPSEKVYGARAMRWTVTVVDGFRFGDGWLTRMELTCIKCIQPSGFAQKAIQ